MNTSFSRVLGRLVIEVKAAIADFHEYVSCTSKFCIEDDFTSEEFLIEFDALLNIRSKDMYVMDMTNQGWFLLSVTNSIVV